MDRLPEVILGDIMAAIKKHERETEHEPGESLITMSGAFYMYLTNKTNDILVHDGPYTSVFGYPVEVIKSKTFWFTIAKKRMYEAELFQ